MWCTSFRLHVLLSLTALYISLAALITSLTNAVASWTLTARNNPLRNDNLRARNLLRRSCRGTSLLCQFDLDAFDPRRGTSSSRWHMPLEDSLERIEMFLMGLSVSSWDRPYRTRVDEAERAFREYRWADGERDEKNWEVAMSYVEEIRAEVIKERRALLPRNLKAFDEAFNRTQQAHWALPVERERRAAQDVTSEIRRSEIARKVLFDIVLDLSFRGEKTGDGTFTNSRSSNNW